jgi:hypothetical protein
MNIDSLHYLQTSLARIDDLIRAAVRRAQAAGHDPTDALRGLVISDDEVEVHLAHPPLAGLWVSDSVNATLPVMTAGSENDLPFLRLMRTFNLTVLDSYILLLCLVPEFDRRYERLYAYLQDDVSQRHPTVNLIMNILGGDVQQRFAVWERLAPHEPLRRFRLVECLPDPSRHNSVFLAHHIKVDYRVVAYLLGDQQPDERLKQTIKLTPTDRALPISDTVMRSVRQLPIDAPMVYMRGKDGSSQTEAAVAFCAQLNLPLITIDLTALAALELPLDTTWRLALREAYLADAALLLMGWESCLNEQSQPAPELWESLLDYQRPIFISGKQDWEPLDLHRTRRLLRMSFAVGGYPERWCVWQELTDAHTIDLHPDELVALASKFRFTREQIARSIHTAIDLATSRGEPVTVSDVYAGAQAHASLRLGRLAKRIIPRFDWDDLILPPDPLEQLHELTARALHVHTVHEEWGFGQRVAPIPGVSALFAGESGTGKTLAAEVIAKNLGLVLYKIDLSAVVSKYIGETEKNLGTIFEEAEASNAILFFDEADALFGKRSEVKDARDRYANIEVAYLLQQIESYDGVAIMATNLRQNLDEAFTRRLDFLVDFPFPDTEYRQHIWAAHFPTQAPLSPDIDLGEVSARYRLAGGNIRNAALASAYLAAADGGVITMTHIRSAIRREHQKMGRLLDGDF